MALPSIKNQLTAYDNISNTQLTTARQLVRFHADIMVINLDCRNNASVPNNALSWGKAPIGDEDLIAFVLCLKLILRESGRRHGRLVSVVHVANNFFTDSSMVFLLDTLRKYNVEVRLFRAFHNRLSTHTALALARLIENMTTPIEEIHLSHNYMNSLAVMEICKALFNNSVYSRNGRDIYPRWDYTSCWIPVWLRFEHNGIHDYKTMVDKLQLKFPVCCCVDKNVCGPKKCLKSNAGTGGRHNCPLVHLMFIESQQIVPSNRPGLPPYVGPDGSVNTSSPLPPPLGPPPLLPTPPRMADAPSLSSPSLSNANLRVVTETTSSGHYDSSGSRGYQRLVSRNRQGPAMRESPQPQLSDITTAPPRSRSTRSQQGKQSTAQSYALEHSCSVPSSPTPIVASQTVDSSVEISKTFENMSIKQTSTKPSRPTSQEPLFPPGRASSHSNDMRPRPARPKPPREPKPTTSTSPAPKLDDREQLIQELQKGAVELQELKKQINEIKKQIEHHPMICQYCCCRTVNCVTVPCGHLFCKSCAEKYGTTFKSSAPECPMCRQCVMSLVSPPMLNKRR
eukprot:GHVQ01013689.1.p1 GENE.GHVQ01013689.1~~GHVQ01013689.1.p1  ORF type:complete len:567 (-),score=46.81 GHVQ01013689.1:641-2341(-)